jgi:hypothetical protein
MVAVTGGGFYKQASKHNKVKVLFFSCCDDAIPFRSFAFWGCCCFQSLQVPGPVGFLIIKIIIIIIIIVWGIL